MSETAPQADDQPPGGATRLLIVGAILVALVVAGLLTWLSLRPTRGSEDDFTGYVVADTLFLSAPVAGTVEQLWVARGQRVAAGTPLFRIDPTSLNARAEQARAQIGQAAAGADADRAALARARAAYANAAAEAGRAAADLARYQAAEHAKTGAVAAQQLDQARIAAQSAARQRDAARDDIAAAQARIAAAQAQVVGTRAGLTDAQRQVTQLIPAAPVSGTIDDTLYQRGEWAPANAPVISLIPDGQVKVRFYVPQGLVDHYRPGTRVAIACDGCAGGMTATIDRIAARPEYTPPVIYSLKTRDKLVFMVEAVPAQPRQLVPGQPIDVTPAARRP
jgi:HlyD family secretion protein